MLYEITCNWKDEKYNLHTCSVLTDNYTIKTSNGSGKNCPTISVGYYPTGKTRKKWITIFNNPLYPWTGKDDEIIITEATTGRRIETLTF